jgi:glycine/D-amino acid oxidase-like deaminating enzyme
MGRFTAYHAAAQGARVVVLERGRVGDPMTASYGRTRSFRNDYLDTGYARLAHEAFRLWGEFEAETGTEVLVRCGGMNIAKRSVTPDLASTYAEMSYAVLQEASSRRRRSTATSCAGASRSSTPTSGGSTSTPASSTCRPSRRR